MNHPDFPSVLPLGGTDFFLWVLDRMMRRHQSVGNVCRLVLNLQEPLDPSVMRQALDSNPLVDWMSRIRFRRSGPFGLPFWQIQPGTFDVLHVHEASSWEASRDEMWALDIQPDLQPPIRLDLFPKTDTHNAVLCLHWHHCLMDSHGAELFLRQLGAAGKESGAFQSFGPPFTPKGTWKERLPAIRAVKDLIYETSALPIATPCPPGPPGLRPSQYQILTFTEEETRKIDAAAGAAGAGLNRSAFLMSAVAASLRPLLDERGEEPGDFFTSIAQDQRKRGALGPILSNQVSFLFFRIPAEKVPTPREAVADLSAQLMNQMRAGIPAAYMDMMNLVRRMPVCFYRRLLHSPTQGRMASCFFSDTGNSLAGFDSFLGLPLENVFHVPPNMHPPGFTVISSRYRQRLQFTVAVREGSLQPDETMRFLETLRRTLGA